MYYMYVYVMHACIIQVGGLLGMQLASKLGRYDSMSACMNIGINVSRIQHMFLQLM